MKLKNQLEQLSLVCQAFGWRHSQVENRPPVLAETLRGVDLSCINYRDWPGMRDRAKNGKSSYNRLNYLMNYVGVEMRKHVYRHSIDPKEEERMSIEFARVRRLRTIGALREEFERRGLALPAVHPGEEKRNVYIRTLKRLYDPTKKIAYTFHTSGIAKYLQVYSVVDEARCQLEESCMNSE